MSEVVVARYLGGGFLVGIPARDLTENDVAGLDTDAIFTSGLYEAVGPKKPGKKPAPPVAPATPLVEDVKS